MSKPSDSEAKSTAKRRKIQDENTTKVSKQQQIDLDKVRAALTLTLCVNPCVKDAASVAVHLAHKRP